MNAGARVYYLQDVMTTNTDQKCIEILQNIVPAMSERSVIVLDAMVLPNQGTHWQAAQRDIHLMANVAGMERGVEQWFVMLDAAGLKVKDVQSYTVELRKSIIVAVPKQDRSQT